MHVHVQIEDTDMEGRLMMADALVYGQALFKPSLVIDVATLTRKCEWFSLCYIAVRLSTMSL